FIDNSVMHVAIKNITMAISFMGSEYLLWVLVFVAFIAVSKFYEQHLIASLKGVKYYQIIEIFIAIGISLGVSFSNYDLSHPIPIMCIIPFIILEAKYLNIVTKIPFNLILPTLEKLLDKGYRYKREITRTVYIRCGYLTKLTINKFSLFSKIILEKIRSLYSRSIIYTIRGLRRFISLSAGLLETRLIKRIKTEELIAIISAIIILLIYFLGDK
ncbi:MAG: hypothetical protein NTY22_07140, partial [Proteobacteria bacterium]|nr:hypothetical protein [Pseudomonadota bacterium]